MCVCVCVCVCVCEYQCVSVHVTAGVVLGVGEHVVQQEGGHFSVQGPVDGEAGSSLTL